MKSQISPWGNSLALRIPKYIADENEEWELLAPALVRSLIY
ncbi:MAG: hypothetical protein ACK4YK_12190 [Dolichospermum sp.]|jgi:antitoxin component of MazEF toxin-antitoxin module